MIRPTPGPWTVDIRPARLPYANGAFIMAGTLKVASIPSQANRPRDQKAADARLITAAPDMLNVCVDVSVMDDDWLGNADEGALRMTLLDIRRNARAAIAKVKGEKS